MIVRLTTLFLLLLANHVALRASDDAASGLATNYAAVAPRAAVSTERSDGTPPAAETRTNGNGDSAISELRPERGEPQVPAVAPPSRVTYESFRIIRERNIFNPNRSGRSGYTRRDREPPRTVRTEAFGLVGTMSYEKGPFAFFDGTSSQYRRVVEPAETIAGYTVKEIGMDTVTLEGTNGQPLQLAVGMQMRRQDDSEWQVSTAAMPFDSGGSASSAGERGTNAGSAAASTIASGSSSDGGESEALKRLLQKREEEFKNEK